MIWFKYTFLPAVTKGTLIRGAQMINYRFTLNEKQWTSTAGNYKPKFSAQSFSLYPGGNVIVMYNWFESNTILLSRYVFGQDLNPELAARVQKVIQWVKSPTVRRLMTNIDVCVRKMWFVIINFVSIPDWSLFCTKLSYNHQLEYDR